MDIEEINKHIHKLKCGSTDWQSVEKLAALCTVRNELDNQNEQKAVSTQNVSVAIPSYSQASEPQSEFVEAASAVPFSGLMQVLDDHMKGIQIVYPKEYDLVMHKIRSLQG